MLTKLFVLLDEEVSGGGTLGNKLKPLQDSVVLELNGLILFVLIITIAATAILMACQKRKLAYTVLVGGIVFALCAKYLKPLAEFLKGAI